MGFAADNPDAYLPEYGNSISAPWIGLLGLYQLVAWKHDSADLRAISTMFFVNGLHVMPRNRVRMVGFL